MSKAKAERALKDNEAKAVARTLRVSPQKLNLVAQMIRGKKVAAALADLTFSRKRISENAAIMVSRRSWVRLLSVRMTEPKARLCPIRSVACGISSTAIDIA